MPDTGGFSGEGVAKRELNKFDLLKNWQWINSEEAVYDFLRQKHNDNKLLVC